jgi:hypothetical protein
MQFISREVNLSTFLITFHTLNIPIPNLYVDSNVRHVDINKANAKAKSFVSSDQRMAMMITLVKMITSKSSAANPV